MEITKVDWDILEARISSEAEYFSLNKSIALLSLCIKQLFPSVTTEIDEIITDGPDDRGVDAINIIESDEYAEVHILQSKHRESQSGTKRTINEGEVLKICAFLDDLFSKSNGLENCNNYQLRQLVERVWSLHKQGKICHYKVIFCSNGGGLSSSAKRISDTFCESHPSVSFEYFGPKELLKSFAIEGRSKEDGSLKVIGKEILERSDGDIRGVVASVDAKSYLDLIRNEEDGSIKRHVFDDNLRVFLGSKGGYNPEIIRTATTNNSYLFWYLNNGVTITCKNFFYNKGHVGPVLNIEDYQIVNGAQTSHSLIEAAKINPESISDVVIMIRVYATSRSDVAEKVAVATNSQARIQSRDLKSNAEIMKKLELAFKERGYFFERKKDMHVEKDIACRIDALKLGQIILSYFLGDPDRARNDSDSVFGSRFSEVYNGRLEVDQLVAVFELYRIIESLRKNYSEVNSDSLESGHPHQYLIYGHWFALFTCALINSRSGKSEIPTGEQAMELVEEAVQVMANACSQQKAVAHYQMFRSPRTKEKIIAEVTGRQIDFFDLLNTE